MKKNWAVPLIASFLVFAKLSLAADNEWTEFTDSRKIALLLLKAKPELGENLVDLLENISRIEVRETENGHEYHIRARYYAGDFWTGDLEIFITETSQRVGRRRVYIYSSTYTDLGVDGDAFEDIDL